MDVGRSSLQVASTGPMIRFQCQRRPGTGKATGAVVWGTSSTPHIQDWN